MKLAFTTLGCPDWDLDTIISKAAEFGFDGVDFRGCRGEMWEKRWHPDLDEPEVAFPK